MDRPSARATRAPLLLAALALAACSGGEPHIVQSRDGKTSVLTIPAFAPDAEATRSALRLARSNADGATVAVAVGLETALAIAEGLRQAEGRGLPILVAATRSPALDAALARGEIAEAVHIPSPSLAAADVAILLARRVDLPRELLLPEPQAPGATTLELLRRAHQPVLEEPRRDGRPLVLGCVWTHAGDDQRRELRARCADSAGALRLLERKTGDPAGDAVDLLALGVDALILEGGDPARLLPAVRAARAVGVPAVSFDPRIPRNLADCAVRLDPAQVGRLLAEAAARRLGERGGLVISVAGADSSAITERINAGLLESLGVPPGQKAGR